jgi:hypothetical protein
MTKRQTNKDEKCQKYQNCQNSNNVFFFAKKTKREREKQNKLSHHPHLNIFNLAT